MLRLNQCQHCDTGEANHDQEHFYIDWASGITNAPVLPSFN
jgi:hypothetical protein